MSIYKQTLLLPALPEWARYVNGVSEVAIEIQLEPKYDVREFDIPVWFKRPSSENRVQIRAEPTLKVTFRGSSDDMKALEELFLKGLLKGHFEVDFKSMEFDRKQTRGAEGRTIRFDAGLLPPGVGVTSTDPANFVYDLTIFKSEL